MSKPNSKNSKVSIACESFGDMSTIISGHLKGLKEVFEADQRANIKNSESNLRKQSEFNNLIMTIELFHSLIERIYEIFRAQELEEDYELSKISHKKALEAQNTASQLTDTILSMEKKLKDLLQLINEMRSKLLSEIQRNYKEISNDLGRLFDKMIGECDKKIVIKELNLEINVSDILRHIKTALAERIISGEITEKEILPAMHVLGREYLESHDGFLELSEEIRDRYSRICKQNINEIFSENKDDINAIGSKITRVNNTIKQVSRLEDQVRGIKGFAEFSPKEHSDIERMINMCMNIKPGLSVSSSQFDTTSKVFASMNSVPSELRPNNRAGQFHKIEITKEGNIGVENKSGAKKEENKEEKASEDLQITTAKSSYKNS